MVLLQSPRIVELEDDESHVVQDLDSHQNGPELLDRQILLADLRTGSPHAALVSLDPRVHEIMNGLADWCDAWVNFPFTPDETNSGAALGAVFLESIPMRELSSAAWRRFVDACSLEVMLIETRNPTLLMLVILHQKIANTNILDRMIRFLHQRSVQILGPRHPVTLLSDSSASRLPRKPLGDILKGILRIDRHRCSIIYRRRGMHSPESSLTQSTISKLIQIWA
jgi:hypothetical protein